MIINITNRQPVFELERDALHIGEDVYPLNDVLYADVVDVNGQQTTGFMRREDWLLLSYTLAIFGIIGALFVVGFALNNARGPVWWLWLPCWLGLKQLIAQIKKVGIERYQTPVTLRVHTRTASLVAFQTENLVHARYLEGRINRAVKREILA